jgi:2,5-diamino-6-(ribosylamino)-4(3H)-pyrimidinone 5'-phosphate reductase
MDIYTGDIGVYYEIARRLGADASLTGSNTIIMGLEQFASETEIASSPNPDAPLLAVIDSSGKIDKWDMIKRQPYWGKIVVLCSESTPASYIDTLSSENIAYTVHGKERVDLSFSLDELGEKFGVSILRIDSGGTLNGVLLRAGLVDELSVLIDPCIIGGETPATMFKAPDLSGPDDVTNLSLRSMEKLKGDVLWLRYDVVR